MPPPFAPLAAMSYYADAATCFRRSRSLPLMMSATEALRGCWMLPPEAFERADAADLLPLSRRCATAR